MADFAAKTLPENRQARKSALLGHLCLQPVLKASVMDEADASAALAN